MRRRRKLKRAAPLNEQQGIRLRDSIGQMLSVVFEEARQLIARELADRLGVEETSVFGMSGINLPGRDGSNPAVIEIEPLDIDRSGGLGFLSEIGYRVRYSGGQVSYVAQGRERMDKIVRKLADELRIDFPSLRG